MSALKPPRINTQDSGSHDVEESSDDHFSSASEGTNPTSPIPITRVERVDDTMAHGEVPGTAAYGLRTQDAVPDEIEIVPEGQRSRSGTNRGRALSQLSAPSNSRPQTPGGSPIPKTVVEKVDDVPSYGEVDGTYAKEMRMADAEPDEVRQAPDEAGKRIEGRFGEKVDEEDRQAWFRSMWERKQDEAASHAGDESDDAVDDFDDFAEGGGDDDFGDFDEAEATPQPLPTQQKQPIPPAPDVLAGLPPLDLSSCTTPSEIEDAIAPYISAILPNSTPIIPNSQMPPLDASSTSPFLSDRSLSLWQQLVSPPPMQPPNWTRSRIRRLFLVSLGVPVDLDEILPPSKQKRLVLPSIGLSPRPSTAIERLKEHGANDSTTSLDSKTGQPKPKTKRTTVAKGPPAPPDFDLNAAALLCSTTQEALSVYSDPELKEHVFTLEVLNGNASKVLEYWLQRKDDSLKEKEALEGVIENLVGFVKGRRGK